MNTFRKFSLIITSFFVLVLAVPAFAQAVPIISTPYITVGDPVACPQLSLTLSYGEHDTVTSGQVSILQKFLYQKGYLSVAPTGYFGSLTLQAVKTFQKVSASGAVDGIVGVQTRAHIFASACTVDTPVVPIAAPIINAITPTAGPTGTVITITGTGFTDSNIVHFSVGGIGNLTSAIVPVASSMNGTVLQAISFTVPSSIGAYCKPDVACPMYAVLLNAGTYPVSVENDNGTSNTVQFTITNNSTLIPN